MRDFFDEQGHTSVFARGVLEVRRWRKPAENAAHRKNSHLWMDTIEYVILDADLRPPTRRNTRKKGDLLFIQYPASLSTITL